MAKQGVKRNFNASVNDDSDGEAPAKKRKVVHCKSFTIEIPDIVCQSCVNTVTVKLMPFVFNDDSAFLFFNLKPSCPARLIISVKQGISVATLLTAIEESGYGHFKANRLIDENSVEITLEEPMIEEHDLFGVKPLLFRMMMAQQLGSHEQSKQRFQFTLCIESARTPACLNAVEAALCQQFAGMQVTKSWNAANRSQSSVTMEFDSTIPLDRILDIIRQTGHRAYILEPSLLRESERPKM